jgi:hypothetical protein
MPRVRSLGISEEVASIRVVDLPDSDLEITNVTSFA